MAQQRLDQNKQMARRNNQAHDYLLRGLVSCGQCRLACTGRLTGAGYPYYICRGRTDALRMAKGERCTARYAPADALDLLVWQDLCRILTDPELVTHELARAQAGEWLPQALQDRQRTLRASLAQLERQQTRLLEVYLAEVIGRDEFERKQHELVQTQNGLTQQLRQLELQAQKQLDVAKLATHIEDFCQRLAPTLEQLDFAQRRQLVELLIDCVIVDNDKVEIRYVIPTGPQGEHTPFCHLRKDHFGVIARTVGLRQCLGGRRCAVVNQRRRSVDPVGKEPRLALFLRFSPEHLAKALKPMASTPIRRCSTPCRRSPSTRSCASARATASDDRAGRGLHAAMASIAAASDPPRASRPCRCARYWPPSRRAAAPP